MGSNSTNRPQLLTAFCLLSFIGSAVAMILQLSIILFHKSSLQLAQKYAFQYGDVSFSYLNATTLFIVYAISFIGVLGLWHMRRIGYWIYLSAQILILLLQLISPTGISVSNLSATMIFVIGYTYFFKTLK